MRVLIEVRLHRIKQRTSNTLIFNTIALQHSESRSKYKNNLLCKKEQNRHYALSLSNNPLR